jgi:hypothetical protein
MRCAACSSAGSRTSSVVAVTIRPQSEIDDRRWVWHVGLDAEASALLNDLYNRAEVDDDRMRLLLCLFELTFANPGDMRPQIAGRPSISRWRWTPTGG